ncbi:hypothetical protein JH06_3186 [Blastocystis sp. subtype 4]|uniref:hypothetical protein n=1 Tax=Blastocystis sp. subtype 4 TaxID=944170 RepID=UPI0007115EE6|nr:hypothetical protein JH06_3186 [Blastocystis sp. subtype 4]KNB44710.1 hypothetical protein JH06_3186 [Blastocystis sp. subtype 4]|eukprot:XP_014528153.1 hypothetical protein JH06_3186 [Blastocystis sp. subtype 4]
MPLCIIKDTPQDHLRQKTRWGSAVEIEKADNMTKQLALEEKENRCRNTYTFKNNTLSGIHIGPTQYIPDNYTTASFTIVTIASSNRIFMLPFLQQRWKGPIICVLYSNSLNEIMQIENELSQVQLRRNVQLIVYNVTEDCYSFSNYPINVLRNIGISLVRTTHYIMLDIDAWPAWNVEEEMMRIPDFILRDPDSVIILPIFFFNYYYINPSNCMTINNCTDLQRMPATKSELTSCILKWQCRRTKKGLYTHDYICADWFVLNGTIAQLNCLRSIGQEPYVLLRHSPSTPLYNPLLFNYGYNKQALIEELRFKSSKWYILLNTFAMDIMHPSSEIKNSYLSLKRSKKSETREIMRRTLLDLRKRYQIASFSQCLGRSYLGRHNPRSFVKSAIAVTRSLYPAFSTLDTMFYNPMFVRDFASAGKSKKSVTKRFSFTGSGKLKRYRAGRRHGNTGKSREFLRNAMHPVYITDGPNYSYIKDMIR